MNTTTLATNDQIAKTWALKQAKISHLENLSGGENLTDKQQKFISGYLNHLSEDLSDYEGYLFDNENGSEEEVAEAYFLMREKAESIKTELSSSFLLHVGEYLNKELFETSINDTELTTRSKQCLSRHGIKTVGELYKMTPDDIESVRNFGAISIKEVRKFISSIS